MAFRITTLFSVLVAFVASLAPAAADGTMELCHITVEGDAAAGIVTEFVQMEVDSALWPDYEAAGDHEGSCFDLLGQLCDDGDFCTIDYEIEGGTCLPYPREEVDDCALDT